MNRDLFLAILAMDAYHRSYGSGVNGLALPTFDEDGDPLIEVKIGEAKISRDSSYFLDPLGSRIDESLGFYAIAYDVSEVAGFSSGETVVSYRGTDDDFLTDIELGYGTGLGLPYEPHAILAIRFAREIVGFEDNFLGNGAIGDGVAGVHRYRRRPALP